MNRMMPGFPQYTPTAKQGNRGVGIVSRIVEGFGWLFKKNPQEFDFGIDGQIEIVSDAGSVTGQMLACQIKCGKSYFAESNRWGYVYRGETKHFNYLANYPATVIIVICDPASGEGFWVQFRAVDAQITEAGWKLTIPFENKLSISKERLLELLPPLTDHLSELEEYWRINNLILGGEAILFTIDREEVGNGDVSRLKEFRRRLTSCRELALHCQGKIQISFNGYDEDRRELFEIEEGRRYIALLDEVLLELFFFVQTDPPANTLMLFVFSLFGCGWESVRSQPGRPEKYAVDYSAMAPWLERHFWGLNIICEWLGLPEAENERIADAIMKPLGYQPGKKDEA
jgi:hypothetical protein